MEQFLLSYSQDLLGGELPNMDSQDLSGGELPTWMDDKMT